jgi:hypothetical protein
MRLSTIVRRVEDVVTAATKTVIEDSKIAIKAIKDKHSCKAIVVKENK